MIDNDKAFLQGRYHKFRATELTNIPGLSVHNWRNLRHVYRHAEELIDNKGWQNPLKVEYPNVLLMGIEGHQTAETFVDFVRSRNPNVVVTIADFSKYPLIQCVENGIDKLPNVNLVQADTTELPFADKSFDLIETDCLLQFLSPTQKRVALAQWYRVLRPDGIVTTRDRFVSIKEPPQKWDELNEWREELIWRFGVYSYPTTLEVMRYLFTQQGFSTAFEQIYPNVPEPDRKHQGSIYGIVAKKPESAINR